MRRHILKSPPPTPMERERERIEAYSPQIAARELELALMKLINDKRREAPNFDKRMDIEAIHFNLAGDDVSVDVVLK